MERFCITCRARGAGFFILGVFLASCQGPTGPPAPGFALSTSSLTFSSADDQRPVTITNSGDESLEWRVETATASWLTASPAIGVLAPRTSGSISLVVNRAAVAQGINHASLQITADGSTITLNVSVEHGGAAHPAFEPENFVLGLLDESGVIHVVNSGGSNLEWTLTAGAPWISVDPKGGTTPPGGRTQVVVSANRRDLNPGRYVSRLYLSSPAGAKSTTFTMETGHPGGIHLDPATIDFGHTTTILPLRIVNDGYETLNWSAHPGAPWVSLSRSSGQVAPHSSSSVEVIGSRSGLTHGLHQSVVQIMSNGGSAATTVKIFAIPASSPVPPTIDSPDSPPDPPSSSPDSPPGPPSGNPNSPPDPPSGNPNPPPDPPSSGGDSGLSGIDATGKQDVTEQLNAYLRSRPDGSVIRFPSNARYRVEGVLLFVERRNITIDGNGATIFASTDGSGLSPTSASVRPLWPRKRQHLRFEGGGGIVIRNLKVQGPHPAGGNGGYVEHLEGQHAFAFEGVDGVELDGVTAADVYGDFVYLSLRRGPPNSWTRNVWIHDSRFARNGRQGITLDGAEDVLIERNQIGEIGRSSVDIEPFSDAGGARRVTIRDNIFGPAMGFILASGGRGGNVEDILLLGNTVLSNPFKVMMRPPDGFRRRRIKIINNRSDQPFGSPLALMQFTRIDDLEVGGNYNPIADTQGRLGVSVTESCGIDVHENSFPPSTPAGRDPQHITEVLVTDSTCVSEDQ